MIEKQLEIWFLVGSQHLYGPAVLEQVEKDGRTVVENIQQQLKSPLIFKTVLTRTEDIRDMMHQVNASHQCAGVVVWMHTFSPAKMWINGLKILHKPLLHFHTQYTSDIPWSSIGMDYMNLHQSAHGGREFGHLTAKMGLRPKVVVGHWQDTAVIQDIQSWVDVCRGWQASEEMKIARIGDNMRSVAVTEGNKVNAHLQFGYAVDGYGVADVVAAMEEVTEKKVGQLLLEYQDTYNMVNVFPDQSLHKTLLQDAARIELGLLRFLEAGGFSGFTDTFENLTGLPQLPGIAVQRLMEKGYGFGAEGDWKTAALLRVMKVIGGNRPGGCSFMEDYTYHDMLGQGRVLAAHMLEICPSITSQKPQCQIQPLGIGGKADPVRLVFDADPGPAINVCLVDLGHRFRLVVSEVEVEAVPEPLPKLPVARAYWKVQPNFKQGIEAWILAGGSHHTCFSQQVTIAEMITFTEIANIECIVINADLQLATLKQELKVNEVFYGR